MGPTESYLKVQYELRPAKQVERRMLIDAFQKLGMAGFQIADYQYTGFGSVYFVDFVLFHKFLGIDQMLSVEYVTKIERRVRFNKPFDFINVAIGPISDFIPHLSKDLHHILWLDFDDIVGKSQIDDLHLAATYLPVGSLLLVTLEVDPPGQPDDGPNTWLNHYIIEAGRFLGVEPEVRHFARSMLPRRNVEIIDRTIREGLIGRKAEFIPLFNFLYKDGCQMLTVGGMIGTSSELRMINASKLKDTSYARFNLVDEPYTIIVPRLTRKERLHLDHNMPCADDWRPQDFDMDPEHIKAYRDIYRYFPAYAELLL